MEVSTGRTRVTLARCLSESARLSRLCASGTTIFSRTKKGCGADLSALRSSPHPLALCASRPLPRGERDSVEHSWLTLTTSSSLAPARRLCRGDPRGAAGPQDRRSSSAELLGGSASTGAAFRPRRCCARPRCSTTFSTPTLTASAPTSPDRHRQGRRAQPRCGEAAQPGRHAPDEEETRSRW